MSLVFQELHPASSPSTLNEEWFVLENTGPGQVNTAGCTLTVSRKGHPKGQKSSRILGTLDPGVVLKAGERVRLICGSPAKKDQGQPPAEAEGMRNYHLFLREPSLLKDELTVRLLLKQHLFCSIDYTPPVQKAE